jgi:hypothetical protein
MEAFFALDRGVPYRELRDPPLPDDLRALALDCFAAQRQAVAYRGAEVGMGSARGNASDPSLQGAPDAVSAETLARILAEGRSIGGVVTQRDIATAIPFNARFTEDVVWSADVAARRAQLDRAVARWLESGFAGSVRPVLSAAGQWWYPPGTYFGWHTNHGHPGWRLYLSHAEAEDRSFFRYRDPRSGEVITSPDGRWHLRLFEISRDRPLWHAIRSETHRFSVGWFVRPWSLRNALAAGVKRVTDGVATARRARGIAAPPGREA